MNRPVRPVLTSLAVAFTVYLAIGGMWWTGPVEHPIVATSAVVVYLLVTALCVFWPSRPTGVQPADGIAVAAGLGRRRAVPLWVALLGFAAALVVPSVTWWAVGEAGRTAMYATWTIGGIGALMAILVVRRRSMVAWSGIVVLAAAAVLWIGPAGALALGVVGSIIWVGGAQLIMFLTDRAARDTAELTQLQREASEWLATQEGRRRERRTRVQRALAVAGPVLARTVASDGRLDDDERLQARLAEGRLRDELRGPRLLDDAVRAALEQLRRAGSSVTLLDEGGLDGTDEASLAGIRRELADVLRGAVSERVYIRTSPHRHIAVTVVGRSRDSADGDEIVDLWSEIPHRRP